MRTVIILQFCLKKFFLSLSIMDVLMLQQSLLSSQSAKERESKKVSEEILSLLSKPTAKVIWHYSTNNKNS